MNSPNQSLAKTALHTPTQLNVSDLARSGGSRIISPGSSYREQQEQRSITDLKIVAQFLGDVGKNLVVSNERFSVLLDERRAAFSERHERIEGALQIKLQECDQIKRELDEKYVPKAQYDALLERIQQARAQNEDLQLQAAQREQELQAMQQANTKSRNELERLRDEEATLTDQKVNLDEAIIKKQQENDALQQELVNAQREHDGLLSKTNELKKQSKPQAALEEEARALQDELEREKRRQDEQNAEIERLLQQISQFEEENKDLNMEVLELTEEAVEAQRDNEALEEKVQAKMIEITRRSSENMKREEIIQQNLVQSSEKKEEQQREIQKLKQQLQEQAEKADRLRGEYEKQLRELRQTCGKKTK